MLDDLTTMFWNFHTPSQRTSLAPELENLLWQLMTASPDPKVQASYFRTFCNLATTKDGVAKLLTIWRKQLTIPSLMLEENDMTTLAFELAVRAIPETREVLDGQLERINSLERKARLTFIRPALSSVQTIRDDFFECLTELKNRSHEPWVLTALSYLHHPIRAQASQKYLQASLERVEEIQRTGDIFFPKGWLDTSLAGHTSPQAADIVVQFLSTHTDYPKRLREKILQSADILFRSASILHSWKMPDADVLGL